MDDDTTVKPEISDRIGIVYVEEPENRLVDFMQYILVKLALAASIFLLVQGAFYFVTWHWAW